MIGVAWIAGLPTPAAGFDIIQNHVDLLSCKVHAVPTRSTATAEDAAEIIRDMCLRSDDGFPDILLVEHDSKFISEVFRAFVNGWGSCLVVGVPQERQQRHWASSATRCARAPTAAGTTGTVTCRSPCMPLTTPRRRSATI